MGGMKEIGKLQASGGASVNNHTTAVPFDIPDEAAEMYLQSDIPGVTFRCGAGDGDEYDTFTASAVDAPLEDGKTIYDIQGAFKIPRLGKSPIDGASAWVGGDTYAEGDRVSNGGLWYECVQAGTSALYGTGPTGKFNMNGDGTCNWKYLGRSAAVAAPGKSVVRVAIFNPTGLPATVICWVL
jgi:hypothetical protein